MMFDMDRMKAQLNSEPQFNSEPPPRSEPTARSVDPFPSRLSAPDPGPDALVQLCELFPTHDPGWLEAILASCDNNAENAIASILEESAATPRAPPANSADEEQINADEELALALLREFAEDFEQNVPDDIRADPERYDAYAREEYQNFVEKRTQQGGSAAPSATVAKKMGGFKIGNLMRNLGRGGKKKMQFTSIESLAASEPPVVAGTYLPGNGNYGARPPMASALPGGSSCASSM